MNDSTPKNPISAFDEICHLNIVTMHKMDMDRLLDLKEQATNELNRAKLAEACIKTALLLKTAERKAAALEDPDQISLLDQQPADEAE